MKKKYEMEAVVRAFEYFALSRSCYICLWQEFQLPSIRILTRLNSSVKCLDNASFIKRVFSNLNDVRQKNVFCFKTKYYGKSALQYHGGILFGKPANNPDQLENTVLSFLLICVV